MTTHLVKQYVLINSASLMRREFNSKESAIEEFNSLRQLQDMGNLIDETKEDIKE